MMLLRERALPRNMVYYKGVRFGTTLPKQECGNRVGRFGVRGIR